MVFSLVFIGSWLFDNNIRPATRAAQLERIWAAARSPLYLAAKENGDVATLYGLLMLLGVKKDTSQVLSSTLNEATHSYMAQRIAFGHARAGNLADVRRLYARLGTTNILYAGNQVAFWDLPSSAQALAGIAAAGAKVPADIAKNFVDAFRETLDLQVFDDDKKNITFLADAVALSFDILVNGHLMDLAQHIASSGEKGSLCRLANALFPSVREVSAATLHYLINYCRTVDAAVPALEARLAAISEAKPASIQSGVDSQLALFGGLEGEALRSRLDQYHSVDRTHLSMVSPRDFFDRIDLMAWMSANGQETRAGVVRDFIAENMWIGFAQLLVDTQRQEDLEAVRAKLGRFARAVGNTTATMRRLESGWRQAREWSQAAKPGDGNKARRGLVAAFAMITAVSTRLPRDYEPELAAIIQKGSPFAPHADLHVYAASLMSGRSRRLVALKKAVEDAKLDSDAGRGRTTMAICAEELYRLGYTRSAIDAALQAGLDGAHTSGNGPYHGALGGAYTHCHARAWATDGSNSRRARFGAGACEMAPALRLSCR